jgi:hydrogenase maturation protease
VKKSINPESTDTRQRKTLILGLGNTILTDDGIGIFVVREIEKHLRDSNVVVKEASLGGLELLELIKGYDHLILIDAMQTGEHEVGTLIKLDAEDLKGGSAMSRHQVSFSDALELGRRLNMDLPEKIEIYGIEVMDIFTLGESCTPEVGARIPAIVEEIIQEWKRKSIV